LGIVVSRNPAKYLSKEEVFKGIYIYFNIISAVWQMISKGKREGEERRLLGD